MKRLFSLLLAVMMCSAFVVTSYASPSPSGGGGDSSIYFKVTVNYYDKETKEKIAESYESVWMSQGIKYDVSEYDAIEIEGYTYDSTTGDPTTGILNRDKVIDVWYVSDEPIVEPTPDPGVDPTPDPGVAPTPDPGVDPTPDPGVEPTPDPGPVYPQTGYEFGVGTLAVVAVLCCAVAVISAKKIYRQSHRS